MKQLFKKGALLLYFAAFSITIASAQVKIGSNPTTINPSSILEIESTNKGLLMPRVALVSADNPSPLAAHSPGMVLYNTATAGTAPNDVVPGIYYNDGTRWIATKSTLGTGTVNATTTIKGVVQLAGDLGGTGTTAAAPIISDAAISTSKLADDAVTNDKLSDNSVKNANLAELVSVAKGGTGSNLSLTAGYVKQETAGSNLTTVSSIPVTDVLGAVRSVNGVAPAANGNVAVLLGRVFSGDVITPATSTAIVAVNTDANTSNDTKESDIYIVSGNLDNANNGRTFIYNGTDWLEVATNLAATDARYVNIVGDIMEGPLEFPAGKKLKLADAPTASTDVTNKKYVDDLVLAATSPGLKSIVKKTGNYTISATDYTILANASSGAFTLTLPDPAATSSLGRILVIRKTDETANVLTFSRVIKISEMITFTTLNINTTIRIQSDGTNWYKID
ncbi:hypothetical protein [Daejeonella sp.]|jgi:hypothetical protein|uniref:hypothetical protein n=1 Tax=Daejeonella sp. TaxID=2805397 RepID=UPI0037BF7594